MAKTKFMRGLIMAPLAVIGLLLATALMPPVVTAFGQEAGVAVPVQAEPDGVVYVAPLLQGAIPYLLELLLTGFFALAAVVAKWIHDKFKIDAEAALKVIESKHRDALHSAVKTAVSGIVANAGPIAINVRSEALAEILRYIRDSVPDAMDFFKPTDDVIAKLASAKAVEITAAAPVINVTEPPRPAGL